MLKLLINLAQQEDLKLFEKCPFYENLKKKNIFHNLDRKQWLPVTTCHLINFIVQNSYYLYWHDTNCFNNLSLN